MSTVEEVCGLIEDFAPLSLQEDYDNSGLALTPDAKAEVVGVLLAIDVTEAVLEEAVAKGCNLVVAHHPLIFRGVRRIVGGDYIQRCIAFALANGISVFCCHTCIDRVWNGVSFSLAEKLGLENVDILSKDTAGGDTGFGCVGSLAESMTAQNFLEHVKAVTKTEYIRHTGLDGKMVSRVALCGGSGADLIDDARNARADIYLTGDLKYHDYFRAEGIILADIGHYESEQFIKERFFDIISKKKHNFAIKYSEVNTNPIKYL